MIHKILTQEQYKDIAPSKIRGNSLDSFDMTSHKPIYKLFYRKAKTIYGITVDGCLFHCSPYFDDGYNPYKHPDPRRDLLKKAVFNKFIDIYLKETDV